METKDLGSALKHFRVKKGYTQENLARGICRRATIADFENNGKHDMSISMFSNLLERLGITFADIVEYDDYSIKAESQNCFQDIRTLLYAGKYRPALDIAEKYFANSKNFIKRQYYCYIKAFNLEKKREYVEALKVYVEALKMSKNDFYKKITTLIEYRIVCKIFFIISIIKSLNKEKIDKWMSENFESFYKKITLAMPNFYLQDQFSLYIDLLIPAAKYLPKVHQKIISYADDIIQSTSYYSEYSIYLNIKAISLLAAGKVDEFFNTYDVLNIFLKVLEKPVSKKRLDEVKESIYGNYVLNSEVFVVEDDDFDIPEAINNEKTIKKHAVNAV